MDTFSVTDRRQYPRIEVPLVVEFTHPSTGAVRCPTRDISEGGLFVILPSTDGLAVGAKVRVTALGIPLIANTPTPNVTMTILRKEADGVALGFDGVISRHLWDSVEHQRSSLMIGSDYFQVYQAAVVTAPGPAVLVVKENGRWLFPGAFLKVGDDWRPALRSYLETEFGLTARFASTLSIETTGQTNPEAAVLAVFHHFRVDEPVDPDLDGHRRFSASRWLRHERQIRELSFSKVELSTLALTAFATGAPPTTSESPPRDR